MRKKKTINERFIWPDKAKYHKKVIPVDKRVNGIVAILKLIESKNSRYFKEEILTKHKDNKLLKDILKFVYNPYIITGISDKKLNKSIKYTSEEVTHNISDIYGLMNYFEKNNTGSDKDIINLQNYLKHKSNVTFLKQIITKNLKIGITSKTLNKMYGKEFIPVFEVMLAKNLNDHRAKIKDNRSFTLTEKLNGMRCIVLKECNNIKFITRQGHKIDGLIELENEKKNFMDDYVYDGELIAINDENLNSNDLFRKTISVARKDGTKTGLIFNIFDQIPVEDFKKGKCLIPYKERNCKFTESDHIKKVPILYSGKNINTIDKLLNESIKQGKEGLMLNFSDAPYECRRTDSILKVIKYNRADVKVIDTIGGKNKNKNKLGAIVFEFTHNDKIYTSECGSGFTDEERENYWSNPDLLLDKIVTISYKTISSNKLGIYSIGNSAWLGIIRHDKNKISMY